MTTVRDFYDFIDSMAPFSAEEPGDNNGILVGDPATRVSRAAVVLDITPEAIAQAKTINAELIVSHHPVLFKPQKNFTAGNIAYELAVAGIAAICAARLRRRGSQRCAGRLAEPDKNRAVSDFGI